MAAQQANIRLMDPRIGLLQEMLARYRSALSKALEKVPVGVREVRPADGAWSAASVIEHLASTEHAITGLVSGFLAKAEPRSDTEVFDRAQFEREIDMRFFLDRSVKVTGSQPTGLMSASQAWETLEASRRDLLAAVDRARGRRLEDLAHFHLTGRQLNGYQWLAFLALHEGRHAAQLEAIALALVGRTP